MTYNFDKVEVTWWSDGGRIVGRHLFETWSIVVPDVSRPVKLFVHRYFIDTLPIVHRYFTDVLVSNCLYFEHSIKRKDRAKGQDNVMRTYEYFPCCKLKSFPQ